MDTILVFSDTARLGNLLGDIPLTVIKTSSRAELARMIVETDDLRILIIDIKEKTGLHKPFFYSLAKSFPLLKVILITENIIDDCPSNCIQLHRGKIKDKLKPVIESTAPVNSGNERRKFNRFDWPLKGHLLQKGRQRRTCNVRSMSAGGAFLESIESPPQTGSRFLIRIDFQDFRVLTNCEIMDSRHASSNLPAGFGVRFTDLTQASAQVIDRIVEDALIHALLSPESKPEIPSIGEEELLTASFDIL
ncbi:MAG: PilZ domain-containing protein [Spirochaetes bacterium]|nr:PilZ domain-containing protein [Spirochaetota bacterium]